MTKQSPYKYRSAHNVKLYNKKQCRVLGSIAPTVAGSYGGCRRSTVKCKFFF